jgi:hypothetical protein
MSLSHGIFSLPPTEQDAAIKVLARKAIDEAGKHGGSPRDYFDRYTRPLLRSMHAAGLQKDAVKALRRRMRRLYNEEKELPNHPIQEQVGGTKTNWTTVGASLERFPLIQQAIKDSR